MCDGDLIPRFRLLRLIHQIDKAVACNDRCGLRINAEPKGRYGRLHNLLHPLGLMLVAGRNLGNRDRNDPNLFIKAKKPNAKVMSAVRTEIDRSLALQPKVAIAFEGWMEGHQMVVESRHCSIVARSSRNAQVKLWRRSSRSSPY